MQVLLAIPQFLIKISLIVIPCMSIAAGVACFAYGQPIGGAVFIFVAAIGLCYARCVWSRIPFATANLVTGVTAIRANCGVTIFAYFFAILGMGWTILWAVAFAGVFDQSFTCEDDNDGGSCQTTDLNYGLYFLMCLALYFTQQVIQVCAQRILFREGSGNVN